MGYKQAMSKPSGQPLDTIRLGNGTPRGGPGTKAGTKAAKRYKQRRRASR